MCGIAAIFDEHAAVSSAALTKATTSLAHRGPDAERQWISPCGCAGLGHRRLSIIGLDNGEQPIASEDGRLRVVVNGEFYDYSRIRSDLIQRGHRFQTASDSEIAVHLYEDEGEQFTRQLRGEFALVVWDGRERAVTAVRDRFGIKPLFYALRGGALFIASEVKALFAAGVPAEWDHEAFFLSTSSELPIGRTIYKNVKSIPPGHLLRASRDGIELKRYWDFDYAPTERLRNPSEERQLVEELRSRLVEAVRLRLVADVDVTCYLSGGIDSAAVAGIAASVSGKPIKMFTLGIEGDGYDETLLAREMAEHLNAEFVPIPFRQDDMADAFEDAVYHNEFPVFNGHAMAKFMLSRAVRDAGVKVVMTGEGSDELFAGYAPMRRDMFLYNGTGGDGSSPTALNRLQDGNSASKGILLAVGDAPQVEAAKSAIGFVPSWFETWAARGQKLCELFTDDFRSSHCHHACFGAFLSSLDLGGQALGREPVTQSLYFWCKSVLPNYILCTLGDRMEMAHSVEGRVPFLDHDVVEFMRDVPCCLKIKGEREKHILREAVRPFVTDTLYARPKHPFVTPPPILGRTDRFRDYLHDTIRSSVRTGLPFFDEARVVELLERLPGSDRDTQLAYDSVLMVLLSTCVLQRQFKVA